MSDLSAQTMSERAREERQGKTNGFDAVCHEPMETFDKEEETEHEKEWDIELVTKDGKGEEGLGNEHPCLVV